MHAEPERPIPTPVLVGGGMVMLLSLLLVASSRMGVTPHQTAQGGVVAAELAFRLAPAPGGLAVRRARDNRQVAVLPARGDDFLPVLVEKLAQERAQKRLPGGAPLQLRRWSDGRVSLDDPLTGRELQLDAFGAGNARDVSQLISEGARS